MPFVKQYTDDRVYQSPHDVMTELLSLIQDKELQDKVRDALIATYNMGRKQGRDAVKQEILMHMGIKS